MRWLKKVIIDSSIDTSIFKTPSVRSAPTSATANQGVTLQDILKVADWSTESPIQQFYYKPVHNNKFAKTVFSSATNNTIDT